MIAQESAVGDEQTLVEKRQILRQAKNLLNSAKPPSTFIEFC